MTPPFCAAAVRAPASQYSSRRPRTQQVVSDFLLCTAALREDEAARIAGVGGPCILRWRRRAPTQLSGAVRERIFAWLEARGG